METYEKNMLLKIKSASVFAVVLWSTMS